MNETLEILARNGHFNSKLPLYKSECSKFIKLGFKLDGEELCNEKLAVIVTVSWENPFIGVVPSEVNSYISGQTDTFPEVENLAHKLYVIASRTQYENDN